MDNVHLFELDANALDPAPALPDDWQTLYLDGTLPAGGSFDFTGIIADPGDVSIFTQGGSKDDKNISDWRHKDGSVPDKDNITNAYAAAYHCTADAAADDLCEEGDLIVYFGADRYANNGDAFMAFWFVQDAVGLNANGTFAGVHTVHDVLVLVQYPQGANAVPIIRVLEWNPALANVKNTANLHELFPATAAPCNGGLDEDVACATTNHQNETSPWPYVPKAGTSGTFPFETFYEGGINITALLGSTPCFSSFIAETRSSESPDAVLKDFVLGGFEVCEAAVDKACTATFDSGSGEVDVLFSGNVSNDGAAPLELTLADDVGAITAVCFDAAPLGDCAGDPAPADLDITSGIATFTLQPGQTVRYEGGYTDTAPVLDPNTGTFIEQDEVTITGTEVGSTTVVLDETAQAQCSAPGLSGISIVKECTAEVQGGDTLLVTVAGSGQNTGNLTIVNLKLTDSQTLTTLSVCLDDGDGVCEAGETVLCNSPSSCADDTPGFTLEAGEYYAFSGTYTVNSSGQSSDTITITGKNFFNLSETVTANDGANCGATLAPAILVDKICEVHLVETGGLLALQVTISGTVYNTGNVDLTNVSVNDDQNTAVNPLISGATLQVGGSMPYSASFFPNVCAESYTDTVTATGTGALGSGTATDQSDTATCGLCPAACD